MKAWRACPVTHVQMLSASAFWVVMVVVGVLVVVSASSASFPADDEGVAERLAVSDDEGSGPDDEDMAYLFTDVIGSDVTFRCYRCTGVREMSGCNLTLLHENPADYLTDCDGHCLNISTADSTVYECTEKVALRSAHCFQKDHILMCVCATDLCNAPPILTSQPPEHTVQLPSSSHEINLTSLPEVNMTSAHPGVKRLVVNLTSGQDTNMTSQHLSGAMPRNITSKQSVNITSQGISVSNISVISPLSVNMTSQEMNMTSPRENLSSEKESVITSQHGRKGIVLPETFKQRQRNNTVIEAASKSGAESVHIGRCSIVWAMVTVLSASVVLLYSAVYR